MLTGFLVSQILSENSRNILCMIEGVRLITIILGNKFHHNLNLDFGIFLLQSKNCVTLIQWKL